MTLKQILQASFRGDSVIWIVIFALLNLSILAVYSASSSLAYRQMSYFTEYYLFRHSIFVLLALITMWITHRIDYHYYATIAQLVLCLMIPLLIATWKYGLNINEASRWIRIPLISKSFQPSDVAQLTLIVKLVLILSKNQKNITTFSRSTYLPMFAWCSIVCLLIALTNSSAALLLFAVCLVLMYIGRVPIRYLFCFVLLGVMVAGLAFSFGQRRATALSRIHSFLHEDIPFQNKHAYIAIATGFLTGRGPGNSVQRNFLPNPYSDFIYAILIEEYGLVGGIFVLVLYVVLFLRVMALSMKAKDYYGMLLAIGIGLLLLAQAMLNMAVAVGLVPVTGLPLPFVSMGGTSMVFSSVSLGMLLSIGRSVESAAWQGTRQIPQHGRYNRLKQ